jgi:N-methylhydantoinase A/oxoprolinase/acetone carboxylase beta subunit
MQNHLTRLKQLSVSESSRQKTIMLELALSQCQSEKKELEEQIVILQQQEFQEVLDQKFENLDNSQFCNSQPALRVLVESLRLRLIQMTEEHKELKDLHATLRLVKRNETDKLFEVTNLLNEKCTELEMFKRQYANMQFELNEIKLAKQHPEFEKTLEMYFILMLDL